MTRILSLFFLLLATSLHALIYEAERIEMVEEFLHADDLWVLVDLDNCLYQAAQPYGHVNWYYDLLNQEMEQGASRSEAIASVYPMWAETQWHCRIRPLEQEMIDLLRRLQNDGVVVMGLTHRHPMVADATVEQVKSLDFSFADSALSDEEFLVKAAYPTWYTNGILFVNDNNSKGEIFEAFLNHIGERPKAVLFIDDKLGNVIDVGNFLEKIGIEYTGIHYTAVDHSEPIYNP